MSDDQNQSLPIIGRRSRENALQVGARKRMCVLTYFPIPPNPSSPMISRTVDPLVHHGRHFGRTVHAMTNVKALLANGIQRLKEQDEGPELILTTE
jgi:hypothetical protein